jgi:hypothetical protein
MSLQSGFHRRKRGRDVAAQPGKITLAICGWWQIKLMLRWDLIVRDTKRLTSPDFESYLRGSENHKSPLLSPERNKTFRSRTFECHKSG